LPDERLIAAAAGLSPVAASRRTIPQWRLDTMPSLPWLG